MLNISKRKDPREECSSRGSAALPCPKSMPFAGVPQPIRYPHLLWYKISEFSAYRQIWRGQRLSYFSVWLFCFSAGLFMLGDLRPIWRAKFSGHEKASYLRRRLAHQAFWISKNNLLNLNNVMSWPRQHLSAVSRWIRYMQPGIIIFNNQLVEGECKSLDDGE